MIDKKLGYDLKTQALIDRMCRYVERKDYVLNKKVAEEKIFQTYDLFDLPRPKKVVWCKDPFDKKFESSAGSAGSARSAWSAWSARSAGSAWSARSAGSAGSFYWVGLDSDFDWFIFEHEYILNPDSDYPINENDKKYLKYSELLLEALEAGCGLRVEWEDTLYLVPIALVRIDEQNRFHSTKEPAIRWKGGKEFYYLHGVNFDKKWWTKIVKDKMSPEKIFAIDNLDYMEKLKKELKKNGYKVKITLNKNNNTHTYGGEIQELYIGSISKNKKYINILFGWGWSKDEVIKYYKQILDKNY